MLHFFENSNVSLHLSELTLLEKVNSKKGQEIQFFRHNSLGKILIINNEIQHIECWASLYHEMLIHIPVAFVKEVKRVLILGGGSLFAAKEVLKYESVQEVKMVDHDLEVIELVKRNYDHAKDILKDKRFNLIIKDAFSSKKKEAKYDLIINDSVDLFNYDKKKRRNKLLFESLSKKLSPNGVCSDVVYRHIFEKTTTVNTINLLKEKFNAAFSLIVVPEYPGVLHLLSIWGSTSMITQNLRESQNLIQRSWLKSGSKNPCEFYDPKFLSYYFYLPPYLKKVLN